MAVVRRIQTRAGANLAQALQDLKNKEARVGWFASSKYDASTPVASVAIKQEFGSSAERIPPRPFMRPTITEQSNNWMSLLESGSRAILAGNESADSVLNALGGQASGDIAKTISEVYSPALAPLTLALRRERRGLAPDAAVSDKPLVDTGLMIQSVTWTVA